MLAPAEAARHPTSRQVYRPAEAHTPVPPPARARLDAAAERIAREGRLGTRPDDSRANHDRRTPSSRPVTPAPVPREPSPQPSAHNRAAPAQTLRTRVSFSSLRAQRCDVGPEHIACDPRDHQHRSGKRGEDVVEFVGPPLNEPNHRRFHSDHLRPALRTSASRERLNNRRLSEPTCSKPAPPAPFPKPPATASGSLAVPIRGLTPVAGGSGHSYSLPLQGFNHLYAQARGLHACPDPSAHRQTPPPVPPPPKNLARPNPYSMTANMELDPADKLYSYLHFATIEYWSSWPAILPYSKPQRGAPLVGGRTQMGREWTKRFKETEKGRASGRELRSWQAGKPWSADIFRHLQKHVPDIPIPQSRRERSDSIFALLAVGFSAQKCTDPEGPDNGLLNWLRGNVLETAVCALHMVRDTAHTFKFGTITHEWHRAPGVLWEGFGTLVLHDKLNDFDRAMVVIARPPSVISGAMMKEFATPGAPNTWSHWSADAATTEPGQVNLLQAQVYDECRQSRVYYFAVTTVEYWVFGEFNDTYTRCTVSPAIALGSSKPNVIQCLTSWVVRSHDHRLYAKRQRTAP
ncbi:uncharacterized protein LOC62_04G005798 [Vanrija pseudolonga]|uniref:Uncharacterized protein n=1 Tax=Vanrija pseudolonga TaxID=143232 RepID=A0AAF1BMQ6_9TREE|nr:hypothetical protein LOC62_04G005798 [Vanrija pseudolonga]